MSAFGTLTLLIALVVATYAGVASLIGARRGDRRLIESGRAGVYALAAVLGLSSVALLYAFLTHDYSIKYVHHYSDASSPLFYQITAYWGGLDGSILWWVFLLSVFSAIAVYSNRNRHRELLPYVVTVLMAIADFFLYVIVFHKNPFDSYLTDIPTVGKGLNPLLQNAYMVTHPPALYTGFVGMSIPFAFGMAALISGQLDDAWIASVRKWTLGAWFFLSMGLTLGMLWAYEELGWGGFWGWDPVENAGFLPWLTATAFLHSIMIQERRGMMKIWNVTLIILTFFLTIFGTFMTRSGIVQSVHAFGQDTKLAWIFTIFMALTLIVSFGFVIKRMPELRSRATLDSWLSREAAFTVNNWILLFAAFFILFATMFPTISEAVAHERITVGPPFFNKWMVPIGLVLLFLTGHRPADRLAQGDRVAPALPVHVAGAGRRRDDGGVRGGGPGRGRGRRDLLRLLRIHGDDHHPGVRARCGGAQAQHRPGRGLGADGDGSARQASLRRLHRARRDRADVPGLRRHGLQERDGRQADARAQRPRSASTRCTSIAWRTKRIARKRWSPARSRR